MKAKLVWHGSGDEINIVPSRPDVFEFYVNSLNLDQRNQFNLQQTSIVPELLDQLRSDIESMKPLENKGIRVLTDWHGDLLDQDYLNRIHREWVLTGQRWPNLPLLLRSKQDLDKNFRSINSTLHQIEMMFASTYHNYSDDPYQVHHPFGSDILGFDLGNVMLGFDNLGRSFFNKWCVWDEVSPDIDTNDQIMLSGKLTINLNRPWQMLPPVNYMEYCNETNKPVLGRVVNLGVFECLGERLKTYRHLMLKNTKASNLLSFECT